MIDVFDRNDINPTEGALKKETIEIKKKGRRNVATYLSTLTTDNRLSFVLLQISCPIVW
jgi:hypothetical protein